MTFLQGVAELCSDALKRQKPVVEIPLKRRRSSLGFGADSSSPEVKIEPDSKPKSEGENASRSPVTQGQKKRATSVAHRRQSRRRKQNANQE